jgi:putative membrane-bound dehydrogenase-like protein
MRRCVFLGLLALLVGLGGVNLEAEEKPIRALLVTGGCCHDYARQKLIIARGISARANVVWTVVQQGGTTTNTAIPLYRDKNWSEGFDVVVHNECFSNVKDKQFVENIVRPHREGLPALLIHCAMHCYRVGDNQWFDFVGMQSPGHGPHYSYTVDNIKPDHPVMTGFGEKFVAPRGELYHSIRLFDTATALGQANRQGDNKPQTCIWTNQYGKGRVFATTIGHYNETMVEPTYLDLLTRGLLWACGKDVEKNFTRTTEKVDEEIRGLVAIKLDAGKGGGTVNMLPAKCCGDGNLATAGKVSASSEETGKNNLVKHAIDGDLRTRWCAAGGKTGEHWQVDLGKPQHVQSLRIHWEKNNAAYRYKVEASADGEEWKTIVDQSKNTKVAKITPHMVDAPGTRHLKVTFLGSNPQFWGSFWEFEAYPSRELPELPKGLTDVPPQGGSNVGIGDVQAPEGFDVTLFGTPPTVNYPVCLAAAADGTLFVGVDEQGSLGKQPGRGKVLRLIDTDGDGKADRINEFARMDHPRGLFFDNHSLWVLHPPYLSVYHDDDHDGTADRHEVLVTGISTDLVNKRGADHTTNGIRVGIDGWIYIAVGDFGFVEATGKDGRTLTRRGGGIVRVRLNGSDLEVFSWGQRNILDVCIDPYMNIFTRDNTNDGGGWDIRVSHVLQSGLYGYPSLYKNFTGEMMPPLADYGGGSGCGAMFLHDLRWPEGFRNSAYTCDWGRSEVYLHNLAGSGATFKPHQQLFLKIPRPTDIDVDGSGRMYVASWKNGKFAYDGPNIGFVAQVIPRGFVPRPFPDLGEATEAQLMGWLASPSAVYRLHSQRELLRRTPDVARLERIVELARDDSAPLYGRAAAVFTMNQFPRFLVTDILVDLAKISAIREVVLRTLTDRVDRLERVPLEPLLAALEDENPRVRAQALISLGRLGKVEAAEAILPLTVREEGSALPTKEPVFNQPDPGRVIPHLAVRALVAVNGVDACLKALSGPHHDGAQWALKYMHSTEAVSGLIKLLSTQRDDQRRWATLTTLVRLYHREAEYKGDWWGTRPDTTGPYYDRATWEMSEAIAGVIRTVLKDDDKLTSRHVLAQLARHRVSIPGLPTPGEVASAEDINPLVLPKADPNDPDLVGNRLFEKVLAETIRITGDASRGEKLFGTQSCATCHTTANGQRPKGPHLVDIGRRYKPAELVESILKPSAKIAQGFDTYGFQTDEGKVVVGFVASESARQVEVRQLNGVPAVLEKENIEERIKQTKSMMPEGMVSNLTASQLADLLAYLQSLE